MSSGQDNNAEKLLRDAIYQEEVNGDLNNVIKLYESIVTKFPDNRAVAAKAQLHIGICYEKLGLKEATKAYDKVVNNYPGQKNEVALAKERLNRLMTLAEKKLKILLEPKFTKIKMPTNPGNGVLSPNGKKLAFIYDGCVWTIPASGGIEQNIAGEPKKITEDLNARDMSNSLCWSGDGKWIAFNAQQQSNSTFIYVVSADGSQLHQVNVPSHSCGYPQEFRLSLSHDGKTLAYTTGYKPGDWQNKYTHVYTIPVRGGDAKELTEQGTQEPAFSPEGSMIAYVKCNKDNNVNYYYSNIWVIPSKGGTPIKVTNFQSGQAFGPVWSPDGRMITFLRRPEGQNPKEVWIAPVTDRGNPSTPAQKIDLPLESYHAIAGWTPDNKIGLQLMNPEYEIIYTVPASGGIAAQVTPQGWTSYPKWSSDGEKIFFRWDGGKIATVPANGGAVDTIHIQSEFDMYTAVPGSGNDISPDGKTIVFSGAKIFYEDGERKWDVNIYTIPVEGGNPTQLTNVAVELQDRFPCWSPDGNSIAFIRPEIVDGEFIMHIYTMSKDGENQTRITNRSDKIAWAPIDWNPDGRSITYFANDNTISSIPVEGGESMSITEVDSVNSQFELAWSPDGKELAYTDQGKLWVYLPESGTTREIKTGVKGGVTKIGWSPDGEKIAFTAYSGGDAELWMMENFLPLEKLAQNKNKKVDNFVIRKVTDSTGAGFENGNPSPDGKNFVFTDWDTGNLAIYEVANGTKRLLTKEGSWEKDHIQYAENSTWSPDGRQIVYDWQNEAGSIELRLIGFDGSNSRVLYKNDKWVWAQTFDWSPDGKQILACFQRKDDTRQIVLVSAENGTERVIKTLEGKKWPAWPDNMCFSPDGKYIVYDFPPEEYAQDRDIYLMSVNGDYEIPLIKHPAFDCVLGWAPDGKNILFTSDRTGTYNAFVVQVAGGKPLGEPKLIKSDIGNINPMGFTRDGSFYYNSVQGGYNIYSVDFDPEEGKITDQPKKLITRFEGSNGYPYYSPDGKYLAYASLRNNQGIICIHNFETGKDKDFYLNPFNINRARSFRWSPDGSSILAMGRDNNVKYGAFRINVQTGNVTPVIPWENWKSDFLHSGELSNDGKTFYYVDLNTTNGSSQNILSTILVRDIETGEEKELYRFDNYINISLSPDGKWLASSHPWSLMVMPASGGEPKEIYRFGEESKNERPVTWTADGKYILFSEKKSGQDGWELCRISIDGGKPQKPGLELDEGFMNLSSHPNGRNIVFSSSKQVNKEIWVMENLTEEVERKYSQGE